MGTLDPCACGDALVREARLAFPDREGAIRLEARACFGAGSPQLLVTTREIGAEPSVWHAVVSRELHPGSSPWSSAKTNERALYERAGSEAAAAGAHEALLADADGLLVEGTRTNLIAVLASGVLVTPPLARGAQAGVGRALLLERTPELAEADVALADLAAARELIAVNALRGPRPIVVAAGRPIGTGLPGPWFRRLARTFATG